MGAHVCARGCACVSDDVRRLEVHFGGAFCLFVFFFLRQGLYLGSEELASPGPAYLDLLSAAPHYASLFYMCA